eukprot:gnl/TRDRNA2_/TRDRNA2_185599_c0_seq1.p1 gnl/TRDRNA2_/TRDRNA2_185599_c0~~gnl/TRDRNA2_/TRDRNA2_185599_c0_seq1.p1  ORF type:complete len:625 (-),score=47.65 gnl/TRDRNA2_/TRDRNA2_185599_c0_seq1:224-2098(-)
MSVVFPVFRPPASRGVMGPTSSPAPGISQPAMISRSQAGGSVRLAPAPLGTVAAAQRSNGGYTGSSAVTGPPKTQPPNQAASNGEGTGIVNAGSLSWSSPGAVGSGNSSAAVGAGSSVSIQPGSAPKVSFGYAPAANGTSVLLPPSKSIAWGSPTFGGSIAVSPAPTSAQGLSASSKAAASPPAMASGSFPWPTGPSGVHSEGSGSREASQAQAQGPPSTPKAHLQVNGDAPSMASAPITSGAPSSTLAYYPVVNGVYPPRDPPALFRRVQSKAISSSYQPPGTPLSPETRAHSATASSRRKPSSYAPPTPTNSLSPVRPARHVVGPDRGPGGVLAGTAPAGILQGPPGPAPAVALPSPRFSSCTEGSVRVLLTSCGLHRGFACPALLREFERLCPGGKARGTRLVYDLTAWMFDQPGLRGAPNPIQRREIWNRGLCHARALASEYGFASCDIFDLSSPEVDMEKYVAAVKNADVYYADVGNTWALIYWLRFRNASRTHDGVAERVRRGEVLYVGASAGAIVAGKSVEIAAWKNWDDQWLWQQMLPEEERVNWNDPKAWGALDLIGGASFFPHYDSRWAQLCHQKASALDHPVIFCANGHGVSIVDGTVRHLCPDGFRMDMPMF